MAFKLFGKNRVQIPESYFLTLAKERYSCRTFKDTSLTEEQVAQILEAARVAPTAANKQPVHVWAVTPQPEPCQN